MVVVSACLKCLFKVGKGGGSGVRSYGLIIFVFHLVSGDTFFEPNPRSESSESYVLGMI